MHLRSVAVAVGALICLAGCAPASEHAPRSAARSSPTVHPSARPGSLTTDERSLATALARHRQRTVVGTFVGATAFATHGTPFDPGSACDVDARFLNIRLVWLADANFDHSGVPGGPPDGPRKDLMMTVGATTGDVCEISAGYRHVGAAPGETLLYGEWPDPAAG